MGVEGSLLGAADVEFITNTYVWFLAKYFFIIVVIFFCFAALRLPISALVTSTRFSSLRFVFIAIVRLWAYREQSVLNDQKSWPMAAN